MNRSQDHFQSSSYTKLRWPIGLLVVILACWGTVRLVMYWTAHRPPMVPTDGLDPAIAQTLEQRQREVTRHPRSGKAWGELGTALLAYEFKPAAQDCFREAQRLSPDDARWPYFHGLALFPDHPDQGLAELRRAVELHRDESSAARVRLATILSELGQYEEAEKQFRQILKKWSSDPAAILGMGKIAFAEGRFDECLNWLNRAAGDPHTAKAARQLLTTAYQRLGRPAEAERAREEISKLPDDQGFPDSFLDDAAGVRTGLAAWLDHATDLYRQGQYAQALPIAQRAVQAYPHSADAWSLLAQLQMRQGDYPGALDSWAEALDRDPDAVEACLQLGVTHLHLNQIDKAIVAFQQAIKLQPNLGEAHHNLGLSLVSIGRLDPAVDAFREAIRLRPGFVDSYLGLADACARSGDSESAREALDTAIRLAPADQRVARLREQYGL